MGGYGFIMQNAGIFREQRLIICYNDSAVSVEMQVAQISHTIT